VVRAGAPGGGDPAAGGGPLAGGRPGRPDPGDGTRTTLGAWDLGGLMDQLDAIYRPDGGEPGDSIG